MLTLGCVYNYRPGADSEADSWLCVQCTTTDLVQTVRLTLGCVCRCLVESAACTLSLVISAHCWWHTSIHLVPVTVAAMFLITTICVVTNVVIARTSRLHSRSSRLFCSRGSGNGSSFHVVAGISVTLAILDKRLWWCWTSGADGLARIILTSRPRSRHTAMTSLSPSSHRCCLQLWLRRLCGAFVKIYS